MSAWSFGPRTESRAGTVHPLEEVRPGARCGWSVDILYSTPYPPLAWPHPEGRCRMDAPDDLNMEQGGLGGLQSPRACAIVTEEGPASAWRELGH